MFKAELYSKIIGREWLVGDDVPALSCGFYQSNYWRHIHPVPAFLCWQQGRVTVSPARLRCGVNDGLLVDACGQAGALFFGACTCSYLLFKFPHSVSWAFSGGLSTLHFQDFPRWLLSNPDVVYLFICHFKSNNSEKRIEWDMFGSPSKEKEGDLSEFSACVFLRLRRLSQTVAPLLKESFPFFFS